MSRRRSVLALLGALMLSLLVTAFAGAASAGGPTSVLLVAPGTGRTASLYTGSADYERLAHLVGMDDGLSGDEVEPERVGTAAGVTITWLIHDAQVWRVDRVDLSAAAGPSISTQVDMDEKGIWTQPTRRHGSDDGKALVALLDRLGMGADGVAKPVAAQPVAAAPVPAAPGRGWALAAGVLLGALLTVVTLVLGRRLGAARRSDDLPAPDDDLELLDSRSAG